MMRTTVGRKPDFARPTSRPTPRLDTPQDWAAPKRSGGGPRRAEGATYSQRAARAGFEPRRAFGYTHQSGC